MALNLDDVNQFDFMDPPPQDLLQLWVLDVYPSRLASLVLTVFINNPHPRRQCAAAAEVAQR